MPTVPQYTSQVREAALPGPRRSSQVPDDAFGNGTRKIGQGLADFFMREQQKADEIAVMDADQQLSQFENSTLYDPKSGALNRRGKDAFGLPDEVMSSFDQRAGELYNNLGNDSQKIAFRKYMDSRRKDIDRVIQRHVSQEIRQYDDQTTESLVAHEHEAAVFNYQDPERIAHSVARIEDGYRRHALRNGLPDEWTRQKTEVAVSKVHTGVVARMLANGDDRTAKAYYDANKDEFKGTDLVTVERSLEEGSLRGESQRQADVILAQHGFKDDRADALAEAKKIKDPKIRDAVNERLNKYFTERSAAETERLNKLYVSATNLIDQTGDEAKIPPGVWTQFSLERRNALKLYAKNIREGTDPVLDHPTWVKFTYLSEDELAKMPEAEFMEKYYPKLDKAHRDRGLELLRLARAAQDRDTEKDPKFATTVTFKDQIGLTLRKAGIIEEGSKPSDWDEETARRYTAFEDEAWRQVEQFERTQLQGKRPATRLEMQQIMDRVLIDKVFVDEWGRDPEVPVVFVTEDQRGKTYVPLAQVPKDVKIEAVNLAKSLGSIPQNIPQAQAEKILARRIERAYGARLTKGTRQEIIDIIRGHN